MEGPKLQLETTVSQHVMMSPQMQQAIALMQMPVMELAAALDEEAMRNPLLELDGDQQPPDDLTEENLEAEALEPVPDEDQSDQLSIRFNDDSFANLANLDADYAWHFSGEDTPTFEEQIPANPTLYQILLAKMEGVPHADLLLGYLDEGGLLTTSIDEIALLEDVPADQLHHTLDLLQEIAPPGTGARNLRETFLLQLNALGELGTLPYLIVHDHYQDLLHNRIPNIVKALDVTPRAVHQAITHLSTLHIHPANAYQREIDQTIVPDLIIREEDDELYAQTNTDPLPSIRLNRQYLPLLVGDVRPYTLSKLTAANWLRRCLQQRHQTLKRIGDYLIYAQSSFLHDPTGQLKPMTMAEVAQALGLHESTIARAVAGKYLTCPRGTFSMRELFTRAYTTESGKQISAREVKERLLELIDSEDKSCPCSDARLSEQLNLEGIPCARRTVAKYRRQLGVLNTTQRRAYS